MDTVEFKNGWGVFRGTHYGSVGVYTHEYGRTYAGERNERGVAHGEGVLTYSGGYTYSGQLADGHWHGHVEVQWANGDVDYCLFERGKEVHSARVEPDGACFYDYEPCGADHADFAKLKADTQRAGVRMPPTRIQRNARAVRPNPRRTPLRFSRALRFWCLASARGSRRACPRVRVCG